MTGGDQQAKKVRDDILLKYYKFVIQFPTVSNSRLSKAECANELIGINQLSKVLSNVKNLCTNDPSNFNTIMFNVNQ